MNTSQVPIKIGVIADDFTGATDVASHIAVEGMSVVQYFGVPKGAEIEVADCVVIALKTRSIDPEAAVAQSREALEWLRSRGVEHVYFKYCSTFDSTPRGNIGPVLSALASDLGVSHVLVAPSAPRNGRTVYQSKLFVWEELLSDSPMRHHPLNPMTESDLRLWLQQQMTQPVGAVRWQEINANSPCLDFDGKEQFLIADAINDSDLDILAGLAVTSSLSSGSAGLGQAIARRMVSGVAEPEELHLPTGSVAILAGSASQATRQQIAHYRTGYPAFFVDPRRIARGDDVVGEALEFARANLRESAPLFYSVETQAELKQIQAELGVEKSAHIVEAAMGELARGLADLGVRRLIVAGGETSGAAVSSLEIEGIRIGEEVDPGVPWVVSIGDPQIALLLKSGNFGAEDFFEKGVNW